MAENPYSPYVDRTNGSTGWGANPTNKKGPTSFPPIPPYKPYSPVASAPASVSAAVARLRTQPSTPSANTDAGSGNAGSGADVSGRSIQGIPGIESIPTMGKVLGVENVLPTAASVAPNWVPPIAPSSPDIPPPDAGDGGTGAASGGNFSDSPQNTVDRPTQGSNRRYNPYPTTSGGSAHVSGAGTRLL